ncbi:Complement component 1 Q subcomponent-binding protein, mitochondrial [Castilleja foliolosa]|uniref:Complement component 1 Q subcomponent-binding protein, mitochondrial n=1 Tax=Castilleja foliolosa TaxID=1961234 RepID=A0ABD3C7M7_9LAMI
MDIYCSLYSFTDLFEVVDRRAKLVVGEKPDDLPVPTPGSNGRGSKPRRSRTRTKEHMELEKRYRELTDFLYYKQTQLETMASEKAAAEFQLEKEVKRLHEAQLEAERNRASRRASSSWEEDTDMKALEPLPLYQRHMAGASLQLQKAAKLLDTGAVRATKFFWRYPIARIILLFYLVFVHLFLMYLLHRLQEQADSYTSKEFEESMPLWVYSTRRCLDPEAAYRL